MDIRPIVKYHGGKGRLFKWILEYISDHEIYCEPFGGAASVLLNKTPSKTEVYNDLEPSIVNLFLVARDQSEDLLKSLKTIEYCKDVYLSYREIYLSEEFNDLSELDQAVTTYVARRMSRGGLCGTFSWSSRIYSTGPAEVHCWNSSLQNLEHLSERLSGVEILNEDAMKLIERYDSPETLFYLDPPYLHSTRVSTGVYHCEMSESDHRRLAELCHRLAGSVILSGYPSELYDELYGDWDVTSKETANHSSHKKSKERMKETLWLKKKSPVIY